MISLNNITKNYDNLTILKNFNLSFEENEITCLFGPSGIGKTTIANIVAKLELFDEGNILGIENAVYSYVFQEPRLLNWYSVYDNIDFVLKDIYDTVERKKIIEYYLDMVELTNFKNYKINALSGGMSQRVSLARAFAYPSNILIMDEPFKGLDIKLKQELIYSFEKLWEKSKRTVLFITHDVDEAAYLSNTIYILKNRPAEIIKKLKKENYQQQEAIKNELLTNW